VSAANGKPVIMFGARHEGHEAQAGSGYGAYIGGAVAVSTDEQGEWWGSKGLGTVPHALIAAYGGDTTVATLKFDEYINRAPDGVGHLTAQGTPEGHVNVTALVDFRNDVVNTSLGVAHALGQRLWGVRVDTSESLVDLSLVRELQEREGVAGTSDVRGVTPRLIELLRRGRLLFRQPLRAVERSPRDLELGCERRLLRARELGLPEGDLSTLEEGA